MGKKYLLDTNTVLDYMGNKLTSHAKVLLSEIIDDEINLSVINKIELLGFSNVEQDLIDFVDLSNVYHMDDNIVIKTIEIRRLCRIKLPDAVIAATALHHCFALITNDIKDFKNVPGLEVINPYEI